MPQRHHNFQSPSWISYFCCWAAVFVVQIFLAQAHTPANPDDIVGLAWSDEGPAKVIAHDIPSDRSRTSIFCSGSSFENRTCRLYNACFDVSLREDDRSATIIAYTGDSTSPPEMNVQHFGADGGNWTARVPPRSDVRINPLLFSGVLRWTVPAKVVPVVRSGRIPENQVTWVEEPHVALSRHYLLNFAHVGDLLEFSFPVP